MTSFKGVWWFGLFITTLIALTLFLTRNIARKGLVCKEKYPQEILYHEYENYIKKTRDSIELFTLNERIEDLQVSTLANGKVHLTEIIKGPTLIYRFNQYSCMPCVENDFYIIEQLADSIGANHIVIISRLANSNVLKIYLKNYSVSINSYNMPRELKLPIETHAINESPFFIVLNIDLKVEFAYTSTPSHSINSIFFKRIISYLKNQ